MTLSEHGAIRVSDNAARDYMTHVGAVLGRDLGRARRELAGLLGAAVLQGNGSWRARSRTTGLDITARVEITPGDALVTTVNIRAVKPRPPKPGKRERQELREQRESGEP